MIRTISATILSGFLLCGCSGSGVPLAPVEGVVLHDGNPLADANVIFIPESGGPTAVALTGPDGKFSLKTGGQTGAVAGKHQVAIQAVGRYRKGSKELITTNEPVGEDQIDAPYETRSLIPETYGNHSASGLSADVASGQDNVFTFELTGSPRRR